ncbi:MAG: hypothetical protein U0X75_18185 [Acidobacteriota bacterium]
MKRVQLMIACGLLLSLPLLLWAQPENKAQLPDTPVGKRIAGYLAAFNSGQARQVVEFMKQHDGRKDAEPIPLDKLAFIQKDLGKLSFLRTVSAEPEHTLLVVLKSERGRYISLHCTVAPEAPHKITFFRFELTDPLNQQ